MNPVDSKTRQLFMAVTARPTAILAIALVLVLFTVSGLIRLQKDTSVKAFIPPGHPALLADEKAAELFGLSDTLAVALVTRDGSSVFRAEIFNQIDELTLQISDLPNIRFDRVSSLATESSISGDGGTLFVDPYIDPFDLSEAFIADSRRRWLDMPPHQGTLVSEDETGAVIMAELVDSDLAAETYQQVLDLTAAFDNDLVAIHVAGPAAVSGYLSEYIDQDASKLQPLVFLVVLGFVYLAFRRFSALPGPLIVVVGAAGGALGVMAWGGIPYFAITNALPVIIVAISIADAIHILSAFYQHREQNPQASTREVVVSAMATMARPITLTTVTTIAGFIGIALISIMPPIRFFAIFAALGVALAWAYSMFVLPNILLLVDPGHSAAFRSWRQNSPSRTGAFLAHVGIASPIRTNSTLAIFLLLALIAAYGASMLRIDRSQVENFAVDEPVRIADELLNDRFAGTGFLDVIIEAQEPDGMLLLDNMEKVRELQQFMEQQPFVTKTVSIVDYLSQLYTALEGLPADQAQARLLPDSDSALAELLFVYEISGDPTDFEEEIDADYQRVLVRGVLDAHYFSDTRQAVEGMERYIRAQFNEPGLSATLTGDVVISYNWMLSLQNAHFKGVFLSLVLVLTASVVVFRSTTRGLIAVVPVVFTVIVLYAVMGFLGIHLEPATSMFAAIALGVGVDFAIHLVDGLHKGMITYKGDLQAMTRQTLPPIARACFFNSAALGIGFSVLMVSDLPTLIRFGGLITVASFSSYLAALLMVPALFAVEKDFLGHRPHPRKNYLAPASLLLIVALLLALSRTAEGASADDEARRISEAVAARAEGVTLRRIIDMTLSSRRGRVENRTAIVHKRSTADMRQTRITFTEPAKSRDVTFLSYDYHTAEENDERWIFLPDSRRVRRIPASQRGNAFLGTDFSYEDIQSELKFRLDDWNFQYQGSEVTDGRTLHRLKGIPVDRRTARELGYGEFQASIDEGSWMPVAVDFFDARERPLKSIEVLDYELIDDIWTPLNIKASNHQTGHSTVFTFRDIEYQVELEDLLFEPQTLSRGLAE